MLSSDLRLPSTKARLSSPSAERSLAGTTELTPTTNGGLPLEQDQIGVSTVEHFERKRGRPTAIHIAGVTRASGNDKKDIVLGPKQNLTRFDLRALYRNASIRMRVT